MSVEAAHQNVPGVILQVSVLLVGLVSSFYQILTDLVWSAKDPATSWKEEDACGSAWRLKNIVQDRMNVGSAPLVVLNVEIEMVSANSVTKASCFQMMSPKNVSKLNYSN